MLICVGEWKHNTVFVYDDNTGLYSLRRGRAFDFEKCYRSTETIHKICMMYGFNYNPLDIEKEYLFGYNCNVGAILFYVNIIPVSILSSKFDKDYVNMMSQSWGYLQDYLIVLCIGTGVYDVDYRRSRYVTKYNFYEKGFIHACIGIALPQCMLGQVFLRARNHDINGFLDDFGGAFSEYFTLDRKTAGRSNGNEKFFR